MLDVLITIINWLDKHDGAMVTLSTFALVCITAYYAVKTSKMVKILDRQTRINIEPIVEILPDNHIDVIDKKIELTIRNDGAINIIDIQIAPMFPMWSGLGSIGKYMLLGLHNQILKKALLKQEQEWKIKIDIAKTIEYATNAEVLDLDKHFSYKFSYRREVDKKIYMQRGDYQFSFGVDRPFLFRV